MQPSSKVAQIRKRPSGLTKLPLAAAICFAISSAALAQSTETPAPATPAAKPAPASTRAAPTLGAVTVTAQKREENLQAVPISIEALGQVKLDAMNITGFSQAVALLPSVSFDKGEGGSSTPFIRGVASGENGNHSGPQPSVGVYLDEQPVTTIGGLLDVHLYDIDRVESLSGPQGTLYGASSQAGTLRIISKKPDPSGFAAGYSFELNSISHGGSGHVAEGYLNAPISPTAAIRIVAWDEYDAGYIDNVFGTRTFPGWDADSGGHGTIDNAAVAKNNYNDVTTRGARAALKLDFGENWTVTPQIMTQSQLTHGNFSMDPVIGDLKIQKWYPEKYDDKFTQAALTVQGKIGNFDLTYAYTHLKRDIDSESDYSDYAFWYDAYYHAYGYTNYFYNDNGDFINPSQLIHGKDGYTKTSHELRISSPQDNRFRVLAGYFWQQQDHKILQQYFTAGDLTSAFEVTGWPDTLWLTNQLRKDHDEAFFGEMSFDFTDKLTGTAGIRFYKYDNSLKGFFGFNANFSHKYGEFLCFSPEQFQGSPCVNLDDSVKKNDHIGRFNLTYKINDTKLIYGTWSEGFRPGGVNRSNPSGNSPAYLPDVLTNYEFGWKTSWLDNRLTFNGAVFQENWQDMQFGFIPPGGAGLTIIRNAGSARIRGLEADLNWAVNYNFTLSGGFSLYDAQLTTDYCPKDTTPDSCDPAKITAPAGSRLPVTAKFKGNLTGRYTFDIGESEAYVQGTLQHEGNRLAYLEAKDNAVYGPLDGYNLFDLSAGIRKNSWSLDFYVKNVFDERNQQSRFAGCVGPCATGVPGYVPEYPNGQHYLIAGQPRTFGIRFSQEF
jgi:outer membrane receptor protein involved in Fe transport